MEASDEELASWEAAAHHEAGHAVAIVLLGKTVRSMEISGFQDREWDCSGLTVSVEDLSGSDNAFVLTAGPMAEAQFCGRPGVELPREACRAELASAQSIVGSNAV